MCRKTIKYVLKVSILVLIFVLTNGCTEQSSEPKPEPRVAPPQVTDVEVDIVMDATPSVAGWVGTEKFKDLIANKLDSFAHPSWTVNYKTATLLNGELLIREIDKAGAVSQASYNSGDTDIEQLIRTSNKTGVTAIVTDLFQTNQATSDVSRALSEMISDSTIVYLIAADLPFKGLIYDVGSKKRTFSYTGDRPLYVIVFGPTQEATSYVEKLREISDWDFTMGWRSDAQVEEWRLKKESVYLIPEGSKAFTALSEAGQKVSFRLNEDSKQEGAMKVTFRRNYHQETFDDQSRRVLQISAIQIDGKTSEIRSNVVNTLNASQLPVEGDEIEFTLSGNDAWNLIGGQDSEILLDVKRTYREVPGWVARRSISPSDLDELADSEQFDGSKTLGLSDLVQRLSARSDEIQPTLASLRFEIKIR